MKLHHGAHSLGDLCCVQMEKILKTNAQCRRLTRRECAMMSVCGAVERKWNLFTHAMVCFVSLPSMSTPCGL